VFLYGEVLHQPLGELGEFLRVRRPARMPEVLSRAETQRVLAVVEADYALPLKLLYGSGLRLFELLRLRVKDLDLERGQIVVRDGKGSKDRVTPRFAEFQIADFRLQIADGEWGCGCRRRWRGSMSPRRRNGRGNGCFPGGR
jgi:integrase